MAANAGLQGLASMSMKSLYTSTAVQLRWTPLRGQMAGSRCFSVRTSSSPLSRPSIYCRYSVSTIGLSSATTSRTFSLWPGSSSNAAKSNTEQLPQESSPDVKASEMQQISDVNTSSALDTPSVKVSSDIEVPSSVQDVGSNISDAMEKVQTLADLGQLSSWPNVRFVQAMLDGLVESTGLPWWAAIVIVTISVRVLVLPLVLRGQTNAIRLANIQPKMNSHMKDLSYAKKSGDQLLMAQSAKAVQKLMKDNNCSPFRSLITPLVLMPVFGSFFFALKGLGASGLTTMKTGGLAWFTDLTAADPFCVLPILSAGMTLLVLETGAEMGGAQATSMSAQQRMVKNVFRFLTVAFIPFLWNFPAAVFCYWATNNTYSLIQLFVLRLPAVRRALSIPEKIQPKEEDVSKGKPLSFWESVGAGKASQTTNTKISRDRVPSVLQNQREHQELEAGREAAMKRLLEEQNIETTQRQEPILASASAAVPEAKEEASKPALLQSTKRPSPLTNGDEQPSSLRSGELARIEEKRRRVQKARERRGR